jgi:VIT1/CCC1 family predicted Fe2+/Mn2+ transporter
MTRTWHAEAHRSTRGGWLRATVLGANDGLVSTSSLVLGVAAAGSSSAAVVVAGTAGVVAGALSMAAGEYVSVSTQKDAEEADLRMERRELSAHPDEELDELASIYEDRGLDPDLARQVAVQLTAADPLEAHARDEIGLGELTRARPIQAALASAAAFIIGGLLPLLAAALGGDVRVAAIWVVTLLGLAGLGATGARLGGAPTVRGAARVLVWGVIAMFLSSVIGGLVGQAV